MHYIETYTSPEKKKRKIEEECTDKGRKETERNVYNKEMQYRVII